MKLYELTNEYQRLYDAAAEADGELSPELDALIGACEGNIEDKLEGCCRVLRNLDADAEAYRAESQRLAKKARYAEGNATRLKDYMRACLDAAGIDSLKAGVFKVRVAESPAALSIEDEAAIPAEFKKLVQEIDKAAIRSALSRGQDVPGAELVQGTHLRVS